MGFLTKAASKQDRSNPRKDLEEQYEKLFPKIGRDFLHRKDFENIMLALLELLDSSYLINSASFVNLLDDSEARKKALEYKQFLDDSKDGSDVYKDLIDLDEE